MFDKALRIIFSDEKGICNEIVSLIILKHRGGVLMNFFYDMGIGECLIYVLCYGVSQYDKNSAYTMSFKVSEEEASKTPYKKIWNEIES